MKSPLCFLCFVMIFLSSACWIVSVHAASETSPCTSYDTAYKSAVDAYSIALEAVQKAEVLYRKAIPGSFPIPSNLKHLAEEYDSEPDAFFNKLKEGMAVHPNMPTRTSAFLNGWLDIMDMAAANQAKIDTQAAYDSAVTALAAAQKALQDCQGTPVVTIYCERGAKCKMIPGVQGNPKAHYVFECPDEINWILGINIDCPGTWWGCDGVNKCPRSSDHVNRTCKENSWHSRKIRLNGQEYTEKYVEKCPQGDYSGVTCPNAANHVGSGESVVAKYVDSQGNPVDPSSVTRNCGHSLSANGDHSLQASCDTDPSCIATNFYACQSHTHAYPSDAPNCPRCNRPAVTSTPGPNPRLPHMVTCSTCDGRYFSCDEESIERHQTRTCWRCGVAYTGCTRTRNLCPGEGVHIDEALPLRCSNPYGGSGTCIYGHVVGSNADEHKTTCSTHGDYWSCNQGHNDRHRSRTCTRCSQSYQNCGNYSSACQDVYWHTERTITTDSDSEGNDDNGYIIGDCGHTFTRSQWYRHQSHTCRETNSQGQRCIAGRKFTCLPHTHAYRSTTTTNDPYVTGECDHTYRQSQASNHEWVETCPQTNNRGQQCSGGNYYECRPHAHTYGSTSTSSVNNDNGDDTENVPSAPSAPPPPSVSYEPCGIHTTGTTGSHSWVTCPTNSSGQNCSSGGYYACQSHRHSYPTTTTHEPCGIHTTGTSGSHSWVTCPTNSSGQNCSSGGYYACQSHRHSYPTTTTHEPCGIHTTGTSGSHSWVTCPTNSSGQNCSSGGYYACQSHTHSYPSPPSVSYHICGIHTTNIGGSHRWVTCPTNSSGQNCSSGGYYACQSHTHSYPSPPPSVTYERCGIHTTGTSGSHSWVTCPTNSSGQNCSSGGYYACQSHTHSYPSPPAPAVVCPANSWTGCRGTVSHATTCAAGHTYYSCNASAAASHSQHEAPTRPCGHLQSSSGNHSRVSCPTNSSGQNCSSGYSYACQSHTHSYPSSETNSSENTSTVPTIYCSGCWQVVNSASEHETTCGQGHTYYGCNSYYVGQHSGHNSSGNNSSGNNSSSNNSSGNNSSSNNSSGNNTSGNNSSSNNSSGNNSSGNNTSAVVCPANRWTGCGGTSSHATTCGRGHTYYTCNSNAVAAHGWH